MVEKAWIDLREAVRVVVRYLPDGSGPLAELITDEFIRFEHPRFWGCPSPSDDDPQMVDRYGRDWRRRLSEARALYQRASRILVAVLEQGAVPGKGRRLDERGQRDIGADVWCTACIDIHETQLSWRTGDFPLVNVHIETAAVRRQLEDKGYGASLQAPLNVRKRLAVKEAIRNLGGRDTLAPLSQKVREQRIKEEVLTRRNLPVCGRFIRDVFSGRK